MKLETRVAMLEAKQRTVATALKEREKTPDRADEPVGHCQIAPKPPYKLKTTQNINTALAVTRLHK